MPPKIQSVKKLDISQEMLHQVQGRIVSIKEVEGYLARGAKLEATNSSGYSLLHCAAWANNVELIHWLVDEKKMAVDIRDEAGKTPLHKAAYKGHDAAIRALLAKKASVNAASDDGQTPLHMAARAGQGAGVKALIEGGASIYAKTTDRKKTTPILSALEAEKSKHTPIIEVLESLLDAGMVVGIDEKRAIDELLGKIRPISWVENDNNKFAKEGVIARPERPNSLQRNQRTQGGVIEFGLHS
jgi:hypothetical protein